MQKKKKPFKYTQEELREIAKLPLSRVKPPHLPECCAADQTKVPEPSTAPSGHHHSESRGGGSRWDLILRSTDTSIQGEKRHHAHAPPSSHDFGKHISTGDPMRDKELVSGGGEISSHPGPPVPTASTGPPPIPKTIGKSAPPVETVNQDITDVDALFACANSFVDPPLVLPEPSPTSESRFSRWINLTPDTEDEVVAQQQDPSALLEVPPPNPQPVAQQSRMSRWVTLDDEPTQAPSQLQQLQPHVQASTTSQPPATAVMMDPQDLIHNSPILAHDLHHVVAMGGTQPTVPPANPIFASVLEDTLVSKGGGSLFDKLIIGNQIVPQQHIPHPHELQPQHTQQIPTATEQQQQANNVFNVSVLQHLVAAPLKGGSAQVLSVEDLERSFVQ